jgi:hypothetical protein
LHERPRRRVPAADQVLARCLRPRALRLSRRTLCRRLPVPLVPHWPVWGGGAAGSGVRCDEVLLAGGLLRVAGEGFGGQRLDE